MTQQLTHPQISLSFKSSGNQPRRWPGPRQWWQLSSASTTWHDATDNPMGMGHEMLTTKWNYPAEETLVSAQFSFLPCVHPKHFPFPCSFCKARVFVQLHPTGHNWNKNHVGLHSISLCVFRSCSGEQSFDGRTCHEQVTTLNIWVTADQTVKVPSLPIVTNKVHGKWPSLPRNLTPTTTRQRLSLGPSLYNLITHQL